MKHRKVRGASSWSSLCCMQIADCDQSDFVFDPRECSNDVVISLLWMFVQWREIIE